MAQIDTKCFYDTMVKSGLDFFCGVPDSLLKNLCACITDNAIEGHTIITANEGNAVAMACGYHIASGNYGVVFMQNSGEGNTINPLLSLADGDVYSIPLLLLIGWRGEPGVHDEPQHVKQGKVTCSLLETMGVQYEILDSERWEEQLALAIKYMEQENKPYALVIRKGTFSEYPFNIKKSNAPLSREEALEIVLSQLGDDDYIVSTTGKTSREIFEIREACGQGHEHDFLTVGSMGHTSSIALGMALGTDKNIWCIDGDGSFLMHMGAFPIIAQNAPSNFKYVLNNNGAHESVGGQPTVAQDIDVAAILKASGFDQVYEAKTEDEIVVAIKGMKDVPHSALIMTTHQGARSDLGRPTTTPIENKEAMMACFKQAHEELA